MGLSAKLTAGSMREYDFVKAPFFSGKPSVLFGKNLTYLPKFQPRKRQLFFTPKTSVNLTAYGYLKDLWVQASMDVRVSGQLQICLSY